MIHTKLIHNIQLNACNITASYQNILQEDIMSVPESLFCKALAIVRLKA